MTNEGAGKEASANGWTVKLSHHGSATNEGYENRSGQCVGAKVEKFHQRCHGDTKL